jgi:Helix-turn-helix domain
MSANVTAPNDRPTQVRVLLRMLREAGSEGVSAHDALYREGIARPAARVWQLKQAGFVIRTGPRKAGEMARYFLEPARDRVWAGGPELVP